MSPRGAMLGPRARVTYSPPHVCRPGGRPKTGRFVRGPENRHWRGDRVGMHRWSDDELASLTSDERAELLRRLAAASGDELVGAVNRHRRVYVRLLLLCGIGLIPWIVGLGLTLPARYSAHHWRLAWVGFDVALLTAILMTAWAAWRLRQVVILAAIVTGTLLVTDAWFDVVTSGSHRDFVISIATAVLAELPLAAVMFHTAHRALRLTTHRARELAGDQLLDPALWRIPVLLVDEDRLPR